jgi:hypothetical protein
VPRALIDLQDGDGAIHFLFQGGWRAIDGIGPHAAQVGMGRGGASSRGAAGLLRQRDTRHEDRARDDAEESVCHVLTPAASATSDLRY